MLHSEKFTIKPKSYSHMNSSIQLCSVPLHSYIELQKVNSQLNRTSYCCNIVVTGTRCTSCLEHIPFRTALIMQSGVTAICYGNYHSVSSTPLIFLRSQSDKCCAYHWEVTTVIKVVALCCTVQTKEQREAGSSIHLLLPIC